MSEPARDVTRAICGAALFVGVAVWALGLALVGIDGSAFARLHDLLGNTVARVAICGVVLAALFHTCDGIRRIVLDVAPAVTRLDERLRLVSVFVTFAAGVPACLVVLWPAVEGIRS